MWQDNVLVHAHLWHGGTPLEIEYSGQKMAQNV